MNTEKKEIPYRMWRAHDAVTSGNRIKRVVYIIPRKKPVQIKDTKCQ